MVNNIRPSMKIVVIGGTGLIGSKVVAKLSEHGYDAVAASPALGVNTITGEGVAEVLKGASVVVDVSNSPSFEDAAVMEFFKTSTGNLLGYEGAAGVGHHVALSIVGADRLPDSGYMNCNRTRAYSRICSYSLEPDFAASSAPCSSKKINRPLY